MSNANDDGGDAPKRPSVGHIYNTLVGFRDDLTRVEGKQDAISEKLDRAIGTHDDHEVRIRALEGFRERFEGGKAATASNYAWVWQALTFAATFGLAILVYFTK